MIIFICAGFEINCTSIYLFSSVVHRRWLPSLFFFSISYQSLLRLRVWTSCDVGCDIVLLLLWTAERLRCCSCRGVNALHIWVLNVITTSMWSESLFSTLFCAFTSTAHNVLATNNFTWIKLLPRMQNPSFITFKVGKIPSIFSTEETMNTLVFEKYLVVPLRRNWGSYSVFGWFIEDYRRNLTFWENLKTDSDSAHAN
jgi:hypothetical protein